MKEHNSETGRSRQSTSWLALLAVMAVASATAGCGDDATGDDGDGAAVTTQRVGWVDLSETENSGMYFSNATAVFWHEPADGSPACGQSVSEFAGGECTVTTSQAPTCTPACDGADVCAWRADCSTECVAPDSVPPPLHAGDITVAGGSGQPAVTATLNSAGEYEFDLQASDWWADGDAITVSAPGATFPAFAMKATAPAAPAVTTDVSTWTAADFVSGSDLSVEWTPGDGSHSVVVWLMGEVPMICVTDDDGSFDVPADGIAAVGSPEFWLVAIDYSDAHMLNDGQDGEVKLTIGTSGASARVNNN
jgi:hypothetical protein